MKIAQYGATIVVMHTIVHGLNGFSTTMVFKFMFSRKETAPIFF
jgi:hypothetical protein